MFFGADQKTKIATLTYDWLRHFQLVCNRWTESYKKKLKSLYILTKKCPDGRKNLYYFYCLYKYGCDTQNCDFFFTSWMQTLIKLRKLKNWTKCWGLVSTLTLYFLFKIVVNEIWLCIYLGCTCAIWRFTSKVAYDYHCMCIFRQYLCHMKIYL